MSSALPAYLDFGALHRGDTTLPLAAAIDFGTDPAFLAAGASALCQVRDPATDALVLSWSTSDDTVLLVDGGVLLRELPAEMTRATVPGRYTCELEITEENGRVRTWLRGPLTITGDVARA